MFHSNRKLSIAFWNAQSMRSKFAELHEFLATAVPSIDILMISETWLKPITAYHDIVNMFNAYSCFRFDRPNQCNRGEGGVAILVSKTLACTKLELPVLKCIEAIGIKITDLNGNKINFISTYVKGTDLNQDLSLIKDLMAEEIFYMCGDFNAHHENWNCESNTAAGVKLNKFIDENNDIWLKYPKDHTYYPIDFHKRPSTIDLVVTNDPLHDRILIERECKLISDHVAIKFELTALPMDFGIDTNSKLANKLPDNLRKLIKTKNILQQERLVNRSNTKLNKIIKQLTLEITRAYKKIKY